MVRGLIRTCWRKSENAWTPQRLPAETTARVEPIVEERPERRPLPCYIDLRRAAHDNIGNQIRIDVPVQRAYRMNPPPCAHGSISRSNNNPIANEQPGQCPALLLHRLGAAYDFEYFRGDGLLANPVRQSFQL